MTHTRTAHHVRRLQASIRDLQNALCLTKNAEGLERPMGPFTNEDSCSRNNEHSSIHNIQDLCEIGAVVLGLQGLGVMVTEALARYGVKRIVVSDNTTIKSADLDSMGYGAQHIGRRRDDHVATTIECLNPNVDILSLGLSMKSHTKIIRALRSLISEDVEEEETAERDDNIFDEDNEDSDDSDEEYPDTENLENHKPSVRAPWEEVADSFERCFHIVFLCGHHPELAVLLNEFCGEFGLQFVYTYISPNGISGTCLSVIPGRTACLQCMEKRKLLKINAPLKFDSDTSHHDTSHSEAEAITSVRPMACLPSTECIMAGISIQQVFIHFLSAGTPCSRVEYDGFLEEFDRSGLVVPVHQCLNSYCRQQQQT